VRSRAALLGLVLVADCASAELSDRSGGDSAAGDDLAQPEAPLAAEPYTERAGGSPPDDRASARVWFQVPDAPPQPVSAEDRPRLRSPARLSVTRVASGLVGDVAALLLDLEAELSYERELGSVLALGTLEDQAKVGFDELAAAAVAGDHDLLLVDCAQALFGPGREAYLFDCRSGVCLARWPANTPPPESLPDDLVNRIAHAYAKVTQ